MDLKAYLDDLEPEQREAFAKRAGTSPAYLLQLAGKHRAPSPKLAKALVAASRNRLSLEALRPDIWADI
jgi:DNA-binding transcriptional regulator YdaS (Cro superfamily)